jgi:carbon storage regulator
MVARPVLVKAQQIRKYPMLVLSRKVGESIVIGGNIVVTVVRAEGEVVRLGIAAPAEVPVHRQEIYNEIQTNHQRSPTERPKGFPPRPKNGDDA